MAAPEQLYDRGLANVLIRTGMRQPGLSGGNELQVELCKVGPRRAHLGQPLEDSLLTGHRYRALGNGQRTGKTATLRHRCGCVEMRVGLGDRGGHRAAADCGRAAARAPGSR